MALPAAGGTTHSGPLSGPQKSLLFLVSLEEAVATRILSHMNDEELRLLRQASTQMAEAPPTAILEVHREFAIRAEAGLPASLKGAGSYLRRLAGKALGEGKVAEVWSDR